MRLEIDRQSKGRLVKMVVVGAAAAMALTLSGCSESTSGSTSVLPGSGYTMSMFDNDGSLTMTAHAGTVGLSNDLKYAGYYSGYNYDYSTGSQSHSSGSEYEQSSIVTVELDSGDRKMDSCGDTLVFSQDGLEPVKDFTAVDADGQNDGAKSGHFRLNDYKDAFTKQQIVLIKSQTGKPIEAYAGDSVDWKVEDDLPKTTGITIDGKSLFIHRANFQIMSRDALQ